MAGGVTRERPEWVGVRMKLVRGALELDKPFRSMPQKELAPEAHAVRGPVLKYS
jgi:hypothetical protein